VNQKMWNYAVKFYLYNLIRVVAFWTIKSRGTGWTKHVARNDVNAKFT
jgi:heme/copper-type cytochrome/quinol oxidase subunit 4